MIVSEVMPSPDCHDDPTTKHGTWFFSGRSAEAAAVKEFKLDDEQRRRLVVQERD
jgi:hypothetical protein